LAGCRGSVVPPLPKTVTEVAVDVASSATPAVPQLTATAEADPETAFTPIPQPLPKVSGLTDAQVASLASLEKIDDYPLYVMHVYGDAAPVSAHPVRDSSAMPAFACSLFAAFGDAETRLYGRNYDWDYSPALMLYTHPDDGYDSVSMVDLGFYLSEADARSLADVSLSQRRRLLEMVWHPFDGMNDQGLAIGMAAVPDSEVLSDPDLPAVGSLAIMREILDHAADVDEALAVMRGVSIDMTGGPQIHYLIADATGRAVLVEYYEGERVVLPDTGGWHLATNHFRTPLNERVTFNCARYVRLDEVLTATEGCLTPESAMDLLSDVAQSSTQWSVVYDMARRQVHVAMGRDYGKVYVLGVEE